MRFNSVNIIPLSLLHKAECSVETEQSLLTQNSRNVYGTWSFIAVLPTSLSQDHSEPFETNPHLDTIFIYIPVFNTT
jgi:hypothetical protein